MVFCSALNHSPAFLPALSGPSDCAGCVPAQTAPALRSLSKSTGELCENMPTYPFRRGLIQPETLPRKLYILNKAPKYREKLTFCFY